MGRQLVLIEFRDRYAGTIMYSTCTTNLNLKSTFKAFARIVTRNINETKRSYYHETFKHFINDIKNTWKTINDTLGRHTKKIKNA